MRILVLVFGSLLLVFVVGTYLKVSQQWRVAMDPVMIEEATGAFQIELTPTFESRVGDWSRFKPVSAELLINGRAVWSTVDPLPAGRAIRVNPGPVFVQGKNELWVAFYSDLAASGDDFGVRQKLGGEAAVADETTHDGATVDLTDDTMRGVRVRIFRDDRMIQDQTLWSIQGGIPSGIVQLQIERKSSGLQAASTQPEHHNEGGVPASQNVAPEPQGDLP